MQNYCVYGGHKSDFDGHGKRSYNNIHVYPFVYETVCFSLSGLPLESPGGFYNEGLCGRLIVPSHVMRANCYSVLDWTIETYYIFRLLEQHVHSAVRW